MTTRRYSAFLLRCWLIGDEQRIEIEHIQTGERTRCSSALSAIAWLYAHTAGPSPGLSARSPAHEEETANGDTVS